MKAPAKIERLWFRDFRGLQQVELDLPEQPIIVFVGANGAGKTSVLEGASILLSWLGARLRSENTRGVQIDDEDVHNEASEAEIGIRFRLGGKVAEWIVVKTMRGRAVRVRSKLEGLKGLAKPIREQMRYEPGRTSVPLLAYYPVTRAVLDIPLKTKRERAYDQFDAYDGAFTGDQRNRSTTSLSSFRTFFEWFRIREDLENEARLREDPAHRDRELEAVRQAVERLMSGFQNLHVRRKPPLRMVVTKGGQELAVNQLSDGEKCLLALVGDLARRFALANPADPNPLDGSGVVLIDELELHLHPKWQHQVIERLTAAFPRCQFLITTHSPAVMSHVENGAAFLLRNEEGTVRHYRLDDTFGHDANALLEDVFGAPPRVGAIEDEIQRLFRLIDDEQTEEARALLTTLRERVGQDPALTKADVLLWRPEPG